MPYNKKNSGDQRDGKDKAFGRKRGTENRDRDQPVKREAYGKKKKGSGPAGRREGVKPYSAKDKDELAPPRFLPPLGKKKPYGSGRGKDERGGPDKNRQFDGPKPLRGSGKPPATWGNDDLASKYDKRKPAGRPGGKPTRTDRPPTGRDDRPAGRERPFDKERSSDRERPEKKPFNAGFDEGKKPFRPKYETEVKLKKSYRDKPLKTQNERKKELLGVTDDASDIRLNKYVANSGICSRREADELIKKGLVAVNGQVVREMGHKVKKADTVTFEGRKILPEPFVYVLMNKPKDFITTTDDEKGRKTVMDLLADKITQRVYPIGRLDRNTTGVLLLTNDGEVAQALTHPAFEIKKVYHVVLDKKVNGADMDKLVAGITLEDGEVFADAVTYVDNEDKTHVGVEIHSGRNRVVRRMFEHLGYEVEKLDRVSVGIFTKKDLPRGKWRFLTQSEIGFLMKLKSKMP